MRRLIVLSMIVIMVFFSGCSTSKTLDSSSQDTQANAAAGDKYDQMAEQANQQTEQYVQDTIKKNPTGEISLEACNKYGGDTYAGAMCFTKLAIGTKDHTVCENIIGETVQQNRIGCYNEVARISKDPTVCDKMVMPDYQYLDMAIQQCKIYASS